MKKIGIDGRFLGEAGPGRYTKAIIQHLEMLDKDNKYYIFLREKGFTKYEPKNPNFERVLAEYPWYSFKEQIQFLIMLLKYKLDLLYVPHFNVPVLYPKKIVTAIPDIIMHTYSTEKGTTLPKPYFRFKKFVYKFVVFWAVHRSYRVIVPSKAVIGDFKSAFPIFNEDKYILAYEGVDPELDKTPTSKPEETLHKYGIKNPYLLYVSSFYEHKNVDRLIEAFSILINDYGFKGQLVLVGKKDKFSQSVYDQIKINNLENKILMPGMESFVEDEEVKTLRQNAELYVFPSLKEGFSLTPLEAQHENLPCVISNITCHKEIYGDSVYYFNPHDTQDIAKKISDVLSNQKLKEDLIFKGIRNVKKYSWNSTAQITLITFKNALKI